MVYSNNIILKSCGEVRFSEKETVNDTGEK